MVSKTGTKETERPSQNNRGNSSSWSTAKDCLEFNRGEYDVFVAIEHPLRGDFSQLPMMRGPRQEEEMLAGSHLAVIATAHHLTAVVSVMRGKVEILEENEG